MRIVDASGREVLLWGPNLGSWLLVEPWMIQMDHEPGVHAGKDIFERLEQRFGAEKAGELYRTYVDHFVTEDDIAYIASLGMNSIRVPFWYAAAFDPKHAGSECAYLDRVIGWAKKHGLYVILDFHGLPGGQNENVTTLGEDAANQLWTKPEFQEMTVRMWEALAKRYQDEPTVAGYDLVNEANGAPSMETLLAFYDRLYKAIRAIDQRHMIFIEDALKGLHRLPKPTDAGWMNVVYSFHYYPTFANPNEDPSTYREKLPNLRRLQLKDGVPFHCGEFNVFSRRAGGVAYNARFMEVFRQYGWSFHFWSYKKIYQDRDYNWGLVGRTKEPIAIDLDKATFEEARAAFERYDSAKLEKDAEFESALKEFGRRLGAHENAPRIEPDLALYPEEAILVRSDGGTAGIRWEDPERPIADWSPRDAAYWDVNAPSDAMYRVVIEYASDDSRGGGTSPARQTDHAHVHRVAVGIEPEDGRDRKRALHGRSAPDRHRRRPGLEGIHGSGLGAARARAGWRGDGGRSDSTAARRARRDAAGARDARRDRDRVAEFAGQHRQLAGRRRGGVDLQFSGGNIPDDHLFLRAARRRFDGDHAERNGSAIGRSAVDG